MWTLREIAVSPPRAKLVVEPAERMPTWAEHTMKWSPINNALTPPEVNQFEWRAQTDTIQSYRHIVTGRHIHIDGPSGQFYDQDRSQIAKGDAMAHAMPAGYVRSQDEISKAVEKAGHSETLAEMRDTGRPSDNNSQGLRL